MKRWDEMEGNIIVCSENGVPLYIEGIFRLCHGMRGENRGNGK